MAHNPALANSCSSSPKNCSPKQLCAFATENLNSARNWTENPRYFDHVKVAKELRIDCELTSLCSTDAQLCNLTELCQEAVKDNNGRRSWKTSSNAAAFVAVAKSYNLSCGIEKHESSPKKKCSEGVKYCSNSEICGKATKQFNGINAWQTGSTYTPFYLEAKNRNLECGVVQKAKPKFSPIVRSIQEQLNRVGCGVGSADGFFGKKTLGGIIRYAKATALEVDKSKVKDIDFLQNIQVRLTSESSMKSCLPIVNQRSEEKKAVPNDLAEAVGSIMNAFGTVIECTANFVLLNPSKKCADTDK